MSLFQYFILYLHRLYVILSGMNKIRYINMCIVEFGKRFGMTPALSFNYLKTYLGLAFLDKNYEIEHLLPLDDTINDLAAYCSRHGGAL